MADGRRDGGVGEGGEVPEGAGTGEVRRREKGGFWDQEPMATIRAHPRRFAWGLPTAFVLPVVAGLLIAGWNLSAAIALQLFLQTVGLLWLYIPPARARWRADRERMIREAEAKAAAETAAEAGEAETETAAEAR